MSTVALPPGVYHIHPAASATTFAAGSVVSAPNSANEALSVQSLTIPPGSAQKWIFSGDGYLTSLGTNNFTASADEAAFIVKSGSFGTRNMPTKFLINVTVQKDGPGFPGTFYTGSIRTLIGDSFYYWNSADSPGYIVRLSSTARVTTTWAFVPVV